MKTRLVKKNIKKKGWLKIFIAFLSLSLFLIFNISFAGEFAKGICPTELQLHQNLRAPRPWEGYIRNGKYDRYTRAKVWEAHILQEHLNRLGFNAGKVDGIIGPKTRAAILRLQRYLGTKPDGYVGPKTRALLNNSCGDEVSVSDNYSGDLKIMYGEDNLKKFISKAIEKTKKEDKEYGNIVAFDAVPQRMLKSVDSVAPVMETTSAVNLSSGPESDYSKTNVQVDGVDEADIVKTDGRYIYSLAENTISILDTKDKKAEYNIDLVGKIKAEDNERIINMYLNDKKLVVISNFWEKEKDYREDRGDVHILKNKKVVAGREDLSLAIYPPYPYYRRKQFTRIEVYNVENPEKLVKEKKIDIEGNYQNSRLTNNHLYLISRKYISDPIDILPIVRVDSLDKTKAFGNDFYYIDAPYRNYQMTLISALDLKNLKGFSTKKVLMPTSSTIYASQKNLYLTHHKYFNWRILDKKIDEEIKQLKKYNSEYWENIPTEEEEKENKIQTAKLVKKIKDKLKTSLDEVVEKTKIEKFKLDGTKISAVASGEVKGHILNQFSMHEDGQENFFIATTTNAQWVPWRFRKYLAEKNGILKERVNNLYSLDKNLKLLDKIENLAEGENIKSVRFVKNHAYLVTFKQIDPLFNIDISNPKSMKVLGELKIEGFSSYLHPVFGDKLIGIGREVYSDKYNNLRNGGIKITLFDISGDKPEEVKTKILGYPGSYSIVFNEHKAVLVSEDRKLLTFPARVREGKYWNSEKNYILIFDLEKDNIELDGKIEFPKGWLNEPKRVLRIEDKLYGIAQNLVKIYSLKDKEEVGKFYLDIKKKEEPKDYVVFEETVIR